MPRPKWVRTLADADDDGGVFVLDDDLSGFARVIDDCDYPPTFPVSNRAFPVQGSWFSPRKIAVNSILEFRRVLDDVPPDTLKGLRNVTDRAIPHLGHAHISVSQIQGNIALQLTNGASFLAGV